MLTIFYQFQTELLTLLAMECSKYLHLGFGF